MNSMIANSDILQHQRREDERHDDARALVEEAHDTDAHGGALARAEADDVGIDGGLHQRHAGGQREQRGQEQLVVPGLRRRDEQQGADTHDAEAERHPLLVAGLPEHRRRRQGHHGVGDVEGEGDPQGLEVVQPADDLQEGNQGAVQPGDEAEDEEQQADEEHAGDHLAGGAFRVRFFRAGAEFHAAASGCC
jgi:hypothetical protein